MSCAYCITNQFHMLVIQKSDGSFHIHAPFQDKKMIKRMINEIKKAEKIYGQTTNKTRV